jgi:hypothetical protein
MTRNQILLMIGLGSLFSLVQFAVMMVGFWWGLQN